MIAGRRAEASPAELVVGGPAARRRQPTGDVRQAITIVMRVEDAKSWGPARWGKSAGCSDKGGAEQRALAGAWAPSALSFNGRQALGLSKEVLGGVADQDLGVLGVVLGAAWYHSLQKAQHPHDTAPILRRSFPWR